MNKKPETSLAEARIREAAHLAAIVESSDDAIVSKTLEGTIVSWNAGAERIFGYAPDEIIGQSILRIIPPELHGEETTIIQCVSAGKRIEHFETERLTKDGRRIPISLTVSPIKDRLGRVIGASKIARDITKQLEQQAQIQFLAREAQHRVKNLLSIVQAIARQSASSSADDFLEKFNGRLQALAACQNVFVTSNWKDIDLRTLLTEQVAHLGDANRGRIHLEGEPTQLSPEVAQPLALAIYELGTNAVKYGALSNSSGTVHVAWSRAVDENSSSRFRMVWQERGGPAIEGPPSRQGFGGKVTGTMVKASLAANIEVAYEPSGFSWSLDCPFEKLSGPVL